MELDHLVGWLFVNGTGGVFTIYVHRHCTVSCHAGLKFSQKPNT